jgi:propanediol dehydratase small subunit
VFGWTVCKLVEDAFRREDVDKSTAAVVYNAMNPATTSREELLLAVKVISEIDSAIE